MSPQSYIAADTPVNDVRVFVDALHGQTRQAALEAAQRLRNLVRDGAEAMIGMISKIGKLNLGSFD